jgi:hypothetical protein
VPPETIEGVRELLLRIQHDTKIVFPHWPTARPLSLYNYDGTAWSTLSDRAVHIYAVKRWGGANSGTFYLVEREREREIV